MALKDKMNVTQGLNHHYLPVDMLNSHLYFFLEVYYLKGYMSELEINYFF